MTATLALKKKCSRCPRVDVEDISLQAALALENNPPRPTLVITTGDGVTASREHLCGPCQVIVGRALATILKNPTKMSSDRGDDDIEVVTE